jgi:catalase
MLKDIGIVGNSLLISSLQIILKFIDFKSLGANSHLIPVNQAKNRVITPTQRDGFMRVDGNFGNLPNYYPNSFSSVKDNPKFIESKFTVKTSEVFRYEDKDDHNYSQTKETYRSLPESYRKNLHRNLAIAMKGVQDFIKKRMVQHFTKVDPIYGEAVSLELSKIK